MRFPITFPLYKYPIGFGLLSQLSGEKKSESKNLQQRWLHVCSSFPLFFYCSPVLFPDPSSMIWIQFRWSLTVFVSWSWRSFESSAKLLTLSDLLDSLTGSSDCIRDWLIIVSLSLLSLSGCFGGFFCTEEIVVDCFRYGKSYETAEEMKLRFGVFLESLELIKSTNRKGLSYKLGVNRKLYDWLLILSSSLDLYAYENFSICSVKN